MKGRPQDKTGEEAELVGSESSISESTTSSQILKPTRQELKTNKPGAGGNLKQGANHQSFISHLKVKCVKVFAGEFSSGYLAPNVKGHHLLKLGPQLFKHTLGVLKDSHQKKKGQTSSEMAMQSESSQNEPLQSDDKHPASESDKPASQLLQKDGPHHVLLAPSVYAEVTSSSLMNQSSPQNNNNNNCQVSSSPPPDNLNEDSEIHTSILHYIKQVKIIVMRLRFDE